MYQLIRRSLHRFRFIVVIQGHLGSPSIVKAEIVRRRESITVVVEVGEKSFVEVFIATFRTV